MSKKTSQLEFYPLINRSKLFSKKYLSGILLFSFLSLQSTPTQAWRLFGWENGGWLGQDVSVTPDGSQCFGMYTRTRYFFGFAVESEVVWQEIECTTN
ncbi:hypothetical protein [Persicitalea jodogahamensis]|uniref:Uncharacterized protein n=1 Tax=Persicitalea jodogahamensis TaxID=402147 RepID=A0A8J3GC92_9BACT|nr:hypothetical protein [Persicitalea jodogahamensis]GHB83127.1 hypothetical protein GCM10007390_42610 [Persicitalea jodogahamensis]